MTELLGGQIGVGDFIFAHKKGRYALHIRTIRNTDRIKQKKIMYFWCRPAKRNRVGENG